MKGQRQLKHVVTKDLIQGATCNRLHALCWIEQVVGEVSIWINRSFFSDGSEVAEGIGGWQDDDPSRAHQSCQPLAVVVQVASIVPSLPTIAGRFEFGVPVG